MKCWVFYVVPFHDDYNSELWYNQEMEVIAVLKLVQLVVTSLTASYWGQEAEVVLFGWGI